MRAKRKRTRERAVMDQEKESPLKKAGINKIWFIFFEVGLKELFERIFKLL